MSKEKRILLWKQIQPELQLQELELGGEYWGTLCGVDDEEFSILFPPHQHGNLRGLKKLLLYRLDKLSDSGLRTLAEAGCGAQLSTLHLDCELMRTRDSSSCFHT